jgi:hypothetical protein
MLISSVYLRQRRAFLIEVSTSKIDVEIRILGLLIGVLSGQPLMMIIIADLFGFRHLLLLPQRYHLILNGRRCRQHH